MEPCCDHILRNDRKCRRFFKVLLDVNDFQDKLYIPVHFVKTSIGKTTQETAVLKILNGGSWKVDLQWDSNGLCFTGNGWRNFVKVHNLQSETFLVFDHEDHMVFVVLVLDTNNCSREYLSVGDDMDNQTDVEYGGYVNESFEGQPSGTGVEASGYPCRTEDETKLQKKPRSQQFEVTIKKHHVFSKSTYLRIPSQFVKLNNIWGIGLALLSYSAKQFPVKLFHYRDGNRRISKMGVGWHDFQIENDLRIGDVFVFELLLKDKDIINFCVTKQHISSSTCNKEHPPVSGNMEDGINIENSSYLTESMDDEVGHPKETNVEGSGYHSDLKSDDQAKDLLDNIKTKLQKKQLSSRQFEIIIQPHNISSKWNYLRIPSVFVELNNVWGVPQALLTYSETVSRVRLTHQQLGNNMRSIIRNGWNDFWEKAKLNIGDVCLFELRWRDKNDVIVFCVTKQHSRSRKEYEGRRLGVDCNNSQFSIRSKKSLFRNKDGRMGTICTRHMAFDGTKSKELSSHLDSAVSPKCASIKRKSQEINSGLKFDVTLIKHNLSMKGYLRIPRKFEGYNHLLTQNEVLLKDTEGSSWCLQTCLQKYSDKTYLLLCGNWMSFVCDKMLQLGDVCTFELLSKRKEKAEMLVTIQKNDGSLRNDENTFQPKRTKTGHCVVHHVPEFITEASSQSGKNGNGRSTIKLNHQNPANSLQVPIKPPVRSLVAHRRLIIGQGMQSTVDAANSFTSKHPTTLIIMRQSYVHYGFCVTVPRSFVRDHLHLRTRELKLWDPSGTRWIVNYVCSQDRGRFYGGWQAFSRANNLEIGDVCVFELIRKSEMRVHIFRVTKKVTPQPG